MHPREVIRVVEKIMPWLPRANQEWRAALEQMLRAYREAVDANERKALEQFRRELEQTMEPAS